MLCHNKRRPLYSYLQLYSTEKLIFKYSRLRFICPPSGAGKSGHIKRVFINVGILTKVSYEVKLGFGTELKWAYKAGFYERGHINRWAY